MLTTFNSLICIIAAIQIFLFAQTIQADEIKHNVLFTHSGKKSQVVLREIHDNYCPYEITSKDKRKGDEYNLIINLDAINHIQNIHDNTKDHGKKVDDSELINLAQTYYLPTSKLITKSVFHNIFASIGNKIVSIFGGSIKYIYNNFIFKILKYSYYWAYSFTKYTVKLTGWYYGTSTLPIQCFLGIDYITTLKHGEFLVAWETYTLNDNCPETVSLESIEKILAHSKIVATELKDQDIGYSCKFYKNENTVTSGDWFAKIRIFELNQENLNINENIWNINCEDNDYSTPSKKETFLASIMKFFNTIT
ncbi:uncharacterized protein KGF55_002560 [Candida pseudojiufengensis]|uniref:uncharacterized protein n=1 Tax=Candida pseudojiufengensis TaxID=497109 RepID=UPI0022255937|nr:uncharacterized protein KGF55_002560 [Candida pseudojiufengensis]KAI5963680.1 hypothetical protein KGF55_002560 [Candida pseudojiufengensis]